MVENINTINTINTPAFIVNEVVALNNIVKFQSYCDEMGLALRPHIKTHKTVRFAKAQIDSGAIGITCQKISEAEAMAVEGIDDILITYNIVGPNNLARLKVLSDSVKCLSVVADSSFVVCGLARTFESISRPLNVLVECDTGAGRCGVQTPQAALQLAEEISNFSGLVFGGLMTYPAVSGAKDAADFLLETKRLLGSKGLLCNVISSGGSPDMWSAATFGVVTEYRVGTYIYNDRSLVERGTCSWGDCAGNVLATVISTPTPRRAIIDAGSKTLTSDLLGLRDYGHVIGHPEISIVGLSEEHGTLEIDPENPLKIGQRIRIIPNHVCVVSNMFDNIWLEGIGSKLLKLKVDARGCVT